MYLKLEPHVKECILGNWLYNKTVVDYSVIEYDVISKYFILFAIRGLGQYWYSPVGISMQLFHACLWNSQNYCQRCSAQFDALFPEAGVQQYIELSTVPI